MPKYWGKQIFSLGSFKSKRRRREKKREKVSVNNGQVLNARYVILKFESFKIAYLCWPTAETFVLLFLYIFYSFPSINSHCLQLL